MIRLYCDVKDEEDGCAKWLHNFDAILNYVRLVAREPQNTLLVNCMVGRSRSWSTVIAVTLFDLGTVYLRCFFKNFFIALFTCRGPYF